MIIIIIILLLYIYILLCQDNCYGHKTAINTGPDGKLDVKLDMNSRWTRTRGEVELMHAGAPEATCGGGGSHLWRALYNYEPC